MAQPAAATRHLLLVSVKETRLRQGRLHFRDELPPGGFATELKDMALDMRDYSTAPGKKASYTFSLSSGRGETGQLSGEFSPNPLTTSSQVKLTGVQLETYRPYFAALRRSGAQGTLDAAGNLVYGGFKGVRGLRLEKVSASARDFSAQFAPWIGANRATVSLDGGNYSGERNRWDVADIAFKSGTLRFTRRPGGVRPTATAHSGGQTAAAAGAPGAPPRPPFSYRIAHLSGSALQAIFADATPTRLPPFALDRVDFSLGNLAKPPAGALPFKVAARKETGAMPES
jgi:hypothetical protein